MAIDDGQSRMGGLRREARARRALLCAGSIAAAASLSAPTAHAQQQEARLEEVVVTAQRREENLRNVAMNVTAITAQDLEKQQIVNLNDLQRQVPSLSFDGNQISIRGISSKLGSPTTGVYIDDTPIQIFGSGYGLQNPVPLLFDLQRVEVLKGPQGTLFGGGAEGGVVRYITTAPSLTETSGFARLSTGLIEGGSTSTDVAFAAGTPLIADKLGIRVSADVRHDGGWIDYVGLNTRRLSRRNGNEGDQKMVRIALTYAATDALTISPSYQFQDTRAPAFGSGEAPFSNSTLGLAMVVGSDPGDGKYRMSTGTDPHSTNRWHMPALKIEYSNDDVRVISSTSFIKSNNIIHSDTTFLFSYVPDFFALPGVRIIQPDGYHLPPGVPDFTPVTDQINESRTITQEFRVQSAGDSPFQWIAGAYYTRSRNENVSSTDATGLDAWLKAATGFTVAQYPFFGIPLICTKWSGCESTGAVESLLKSYDIALFGEASYKFAEHWKVTVGGRQTRNHLSYDNHQYGPLVGGDQRTAGDDDASAFTPKVSLAYQPNPDNLYYVTVAKGFRNGGGNQPTPAAICDSGFRALGLNGAPPTFDPDTTWNYEIGAKNRLLNGRLTLDSSAYVVKWNQIQNSITLPCFFTVVLNSGKVEAKGFETTINALLSDHVTANAAIGYLHAAYTQAIAAIPGSLAPASVGDRLNDPTWKVAAGLQYDTEIGSHEAFARLDYTMNRFSGPTTATNPKDVSYNPLVPLPANWNYLTGRAGMKFGALDVALFIDNLTNSTKVLRTVNPHAGANYFTFLSWRPRTYTVEARYSF